METIGGYNVFFHQSNLVHSWLEHPEGHGRSSCGKLNLLQFQVHLSPYIFYNYNFKKSKSPSSCGIVSSSSSITSSVTSIVAITVTSTLWEGSLLVVSLVTSSTNTCLCRWILNVISSA